MRVIGRRVTEVVEGGLCDPCRRVSGSPFAAVAPYLGDRIHTRVVCAICRTLGWGCPSGMVQRTADTKHTDPSAL
jgi:hypothetical protein